MAAQGEIIVTEDEVKAVENSMASLEERAREIARAEYSADLSSGSGVMALVGVGGALLGFATALVDAIGRTRAEVAESLETFSATDEGVSAAIDARNAR